MDERQGINRLKSRLYMFFPSGHYACRQVSLDILSVRNVPTEFPTKVGLSKLYVKR